MLIGEFGHLRSFKQHASHMIEIDWQVLSRPGKKRAQGRGRKEIRGSGSREKGGRQLMYSELVTSGLEWSYC